MGELIYKIDKVLSEKDNALVIKIQQAEREGYILKPYNDQSPLTRERLQRLSTPKDEGLIPFLIKEETTYAKKNFGRILSDKDPFNIIHIPYGMLPQAFKLFAMTGKLYFNDKQLVIDLFGKTEFYYGVDFSTDKPKAIGFIKTGDQDFLISTCDLVGRGPPHWFVKGIQLKFISTDISWKDLKMTFDGQPRRLEELVEDAKEDPEAPRVIHQEPFQSFQQEPLPVLVLIDRLGSFANLWMNYGENSTFVPFHDSSISVQKHNKSFCKRQLHVEQSWEKDLLESAFIKKPVGNSHYYCALDKVAKSIAFLLEIGWQVTDMRGNRVVQHRHTELVADSLSNDMVIKGKLHFANFDADLTNIVGAFNRRERFAEIAPGHVALLPNSLEQIGLNTVVEEGEIIGDGIRIKKNRFGALSEFFEKHPQITLDKGVSLLKEKMGNFQALAHVSPGQKFCGTLRPYQQEGLNWLAFLYDFYFHGLLADDMGLGKTVQVLAFLSRIEFTSPVLIVVPTSLIFNWKKEIERFLPGTRVLIHHGPNRQTSLEKLIPSQIILTTYTTARLDFALLSQISYTCLILDEAQAIKNANTQTSQILTQLNSRFRLSITGTPIENNISELWSHFRFLIPDLLGDEAGFNGEVQAGQSDPRFLKRLKKKIRPFFLRRCKEDVAKDLPPKIEQTVWIEMQEGQRAIYENFLSGIRRNLITKVNADGVGKHRMEILESIMRLRQICCDPQLVNLEDKERAESAKLDALLEDLTTAVAEKRKVLVYSQFTSMLALIAKRLKMHGWEYAYLDGSTKNREQVVTQFQEDPNLFIFLISLKAGGIGLNLTAADYVFLYDPWWNAAVENQAIDRAHRIGRQDTVIAKRYIMAESIEEKMMKLKANKTALATEMMDDEGQIPSSLTSDDLLFLLT